jgi:hypothetical protein
MIALDYNNDPYQKRKYHKILDIFGDAEHQAVSYTYPLRTKNNNVTEFLKQVWTKCNQEVLQTKIAF